MTSWTITCTLVAPVVLSSRTPLVDDALLSAAEALRRWGGTAMTRQPVAGSDWIDRLPLPVAEDGGHWACSLVTFHPPCVRMADRLYKTAEARLTSPTVRSSGARKAAVVDLTTWSVPRISFDVDTTGDAQTAALGVSRPCRRTGCGIRTPPSSWPCARNLPAGMVRKSGAPCCIRTPGCRSP